jgi:hypothetical protein
MDSSGDHDGWRQRDPNGWQQRGWGMAAQWAAGWQSNCNGRWDGGGAMDGTMGSRQLPADEGTEMGAMVFGWLVSCEIRSGRAR